MKLNLGCGQSIIEGYINLDRNDYGQEVIRDVLRGLPFDNNKFEQVHTSHFMEHVPTGDNLYFILSEIWRVCIPGAHFIIIVPHSDTHEAFFPDHLSYWNEEMLTAISTDPYQRSKNLPYNFNIVSMHREGIELRAVLEIIK